jgi:hypothetical protein
MTRPLPRTSVWPVDWPLFPAFPCWRKRRAERHFSRLSPSNRLPCSLLRTAVPMRCSGMAAFPLLPRTMPPPSGRGRCSRLPVTLQRCSERLQPGRVQRGGATLAPSLLQMYLPSCWIRSLQYSASCGRHCQATPPRPRRPFSTSWHVAAESLSLRSISSWRRCLCSTAALRICASFRFGSGSASGDLAQQSRPSIRVLRNRSSSDPFCPERNRSGEIGLGRPICRFSRRRATRTPVTRTSMLRTVTALGQERPIGFPPLPAPAEQAVRTAIIVREHLAGRETVGVSSRRLDG